MTTLLDWIEALPEGHPARREGAGEPLPLAPRPFAAARVDPRLWLNAWRAGAPIWWMRQGSRGWLATGGGTESFRRPRAADPAVLWPRPAGVLVFSHRAVWAAIVGTAELGAAGRGGEGPLAFVLGAAAWLQGDPFGTGPELYADPKASGCLTDGRRRWAAADALLGAYRRVAPDDVWDPGTKPAGERGAVKSARLFDGWWRQGEWTPGRFPGGCWHLGPARDGLRR